MAETKTVAFRLDESIKEEWEQAAESPEYESLSHLIRLAVQREIADSDTAPRNAQADTQSDNSEVIQSLNRVERIVEDVQEEVETFSRERQSEQQFELKQVLIEVLPTAPGTYSPAPDEVEVSDVGEKPREIAGRIGADTSDVSAALEELANNIGQVREFNSYYWKAEE